MSTIADLLAALGDHLGPGGDTYSIRMPIEDTFAARGPTGKAALLVPIVGDATVPGRAFEGITLDFSPRVRFSVPEKTWEAPAAAITCQDETLLRTFCVLCADIAGKLARGQPASARDVIEALREWEDLLRAQARLSDDDEVGLFGELWLLASMSEIDKAVRAWRGPEGFTVDFFSGSVGIECKASKTRLRHHVSHDQIAVERDFPVYVVSLWVGLDPGSGLTLPELIASIEARITDTVTWERMLLKAGYRRTAAASYTNKYNVIDTPKWFRDEDVPRVRVADPGVRQLRYVVELDPEKVIGAEEAGDVMATFLARR